MTSGADTAEVCKLDLEDQAMGLPTETVYLQVASICALHGCLSSRLCCSLHVISQIISQAQSSPLTIHV